MSSNGRSARFVRKRRRCPCQRPNRLRDLTAKRDGESREMTDRRVTRTRAMLQQALMSLIPRKDYDAITVQDICDAANVGRSTFYAHFTSKDDLKRSGFEHLRKELADRQRTAMATRRHTRPKVGLQPGHVRTCPRLPGAASRTGSRPRRRYRALQHPADTFGSGTRRACGNRRQQLFGPGSARAS